MEVSEARVGRHSFAKSGALSPVPAAPDARVARGEREVTMLCDREYGCGAPIRDKGVCDD
jgi:hypothetical protein